MNREAWLAERRTGIGSSDCPAVCGLSPWATPYHVYLDKVGELPEQEMTPAMAWGLLLEPVIARAYEGQTGRRLYQPAQPVLRHEQYAWMLATPDRVAVNGHAACDRIVELKTCNAFAADEWGEPGSDQVPEPYIAQVQHQLAVTGFALADVAVLIGGSDFRVYTVERNEPLIARLVEIEDAFWERVLLRAPPPPDWAHARTPELIEALYAAGDGSVTLDTAALDLASEYVALGAEGKELDRRRQVVKAQLVERLGTAGIGFLSDGSKIVRKRITRAAYSVPEGSYHTFTVKRPKEPADE